MSNTLLVIVLVGLKFGLPVLLLRFPFAAGWANFVLDTVDGDLLIPAGLSDAVYQNVDKAADYVTYVFMVLAARRWPIFRLAVVLFAIRTVGQALFFLTHNELVFFFFPNFLEPLFLIYATIEVFKKTEAPRVYAKYWIPIWIFIVLYKMQDEWVTHVGNIDRSELLRGIFS